MSEPIPTPEDPNPPEWPTDPTLPDEDGTPPDVVEPEPTPEPEAQPGWATYADEAAAEAITQATEIAGRLAPRNIDRAPTAEDGEGLPAGTGWNEYDPATDDLVQMWRWDGTVWARLDMSPELIPVIDIGSGTVGDLHGDRIVAHTISADSINGGAFTGETFTGGTFTGGEFRTSDALPGQVTLSDAGLHSDLNGGFTAPGIQVTPADTSGMTYPAGLGPSASGLMIYGGKRVDTGSSIVQANPAESLMRTYRADGSAGGVMQTAPETSLMRTYRADGSAGGVMQTAPETSLMRTYRADGSTGGLMQTSPDGAVIQTSREDGGVGSEMASSPTGSLMRTYRADGSTSGVMQTGDGYSLARTYSGDGSESGYMRVEPKSVRLAYIDSSNTYFSRIHADAKEAYLYTGAGGVSRYLLVDANGVWVKTYKGGAWKSYNLEQTAQDSGWTALSYASGFKYWGNGAPYEYRTMGNMFHLRGRVARTSGTFAAGTEYTLGTLDASLRPTHTQRTIVAGGSATNWGRVEINASSGTITVAMISGSADWIDLGGTSWTLD